MLLYARVQIAQKACCGHCTSVWWVPLRLATRCKAAWAVSATRRFRVCCDAQEWHLLKRPTAARKESTAADVFTTDFFIGLAMGLCAGAWVGLGWQWHICVYA